MIITEMLVLIILFCIMAIGSYALYAHSKKVREQMMDELDRELAEDWDVTNEDGLEE